MVTLTIARMGPSMPCTPHARGKSIWVTSEVTARSANSIFRVVRHFVPTAVGPPVSMCPPRTLRYHSTKQVGSVT